MTTTPEEFKQPFSEHLRELRRRLVFCVGYIVAGFGVAWFFHQPLFTWLMEPYVQGMSALHPELDRLISFRSVIEPIVVYLKTALLASLIAVMPLILHQLWLFVAPGLYDHERRLALPFLAMSFVCFIGGAVFCRYIVLEPAITVLVGAGGVNTSPNIMMQEYFSFTSKMLLVFGFLFELPVVITFLSLVGAVTHRGLIRNWRYALLAAFVVGAMLTPPDPLTQLAMAVPLVLLYAISILIAYVITRGRERREAPTPPRDGKSE